MSDNLSAFVDKARERGLSDEEIRQKLTQNGWSQDKIDAALDDLAVPSPEDDLVVPQPGNEAGQVVVSHDTANQSGQAGQPISVVNTLSVRGFEYSIMFLSMLFSAFAFGSLLHNWLDNTFASDTTYDWGGSSGVTTFYITMLIVFFPIFTFLFLRLKRAELADRSLLKDPSRRRWSQFSQLVSFLVGVGYLIYFIYSLLTPDPYETSGRSVLLTFVHLLVTLSIAGAIFVYLWRTDHRSENV